MRDALTEPHTRPMSLRWGEPSAPRVTYGGCPEDESDEFARRWPEPQPVTVRDLLRAAWRAGLVLQWKRPGFWMLQHRDGFPWPAWVELHSNGVWEVDLRASDGRCSITLLDPTLDEIALAAQTCGWDTRRRP